MRLGVNLEGYFFDTHRLIGKERHIVTWKYENIEVYIESCVAQFFENNSRQSRMRVFYRKELSFLKGLTDSVSKKILQLFI